MGRLMDGSLSLLVQHGLELFFDAFFLLLALDSDKVAMREWEVLFGRLILDHLLERLHLGLLFKHFLGLKFLHQNLVVLLLDADVVKLLDLVGQLG